MRHYPLGGFYVNYQTPSRQDVEVAIKGLEIEDEREKEALRKFYARERKQNRAANIKLAKAIGFFLIKIVLITAVVAAILWMT